MNRAPNENKINLDTTCSLCTDVPLLPIFSEGGGVGGGRGRLYTGYTTW